MLTIVAILRYVVEDDNIGSVCYYRVGQVIIIKARCNRAFTTSMEVSSPIHAPKNNANPTHACTCTIRQAHDLECVHTQCDKRFLSFDSPTRCNPSALTPHLLSPGSVSVCV